MQKIWQKPELIVLRKGQMQEAVLTHCKSVNLHGEVDVVNPGQGCGNPKEGSCQSCQARPPAS
jgi:hypothetical protein